MNDQEMIDIWKNYDAKLVGALAVNQANTVEITRLKVSSQLSAMKPIKWFAIVVGIAWCAFLFSILGASVLHESLYIPFTVFIGGLALINAIGVGTYIYHLVLIDRIEQDEEIISSLRQLANLKTSTLNVTRILILQMPFYFALHLFIANDAGTFFWVINGLIIAAITCFTLWLFVSIDVKNRNKGWFKLLFNDREWNGVTRSIELLEQIEEFENENAR